MKDCSEIKGYSLINNIIKKLFKWFRALGTVQVLHEKLGWPFVQSWKQSDSDLDILILMVLPPLPESNWDLCCTLSLSYKFHSNQWSIQLYLQLQADHKPHWLKVHESDHDFSDDYWSLHPYLTVVNPIQMLLTKICRIIEDVHTRTRCKCKNDVKRQIHI